MKAATLGVVRPPAASTTSPGAPAIAQGTSACSNIEMSFQESPTAATSLTSMPWSASSSASRPRPIPLDSPAAVTSTKPVERVQLMPSTVSSRPLASAAAVRTSGMCSGMEVTPRPATCDRGATVKRSGGVRWSVDRPIGSSST